MDVRGAEAVEIDHLAKVWYVSWQDAHAQIVPAELTRLRTLESFRERLQADLSNVRVVGPIGAPVGVCSVKGDELYQLFVSAHSRGSGIAAALIADAEARLTERGAEILQFIKGLSDAETNRVGIHPLLGQMDVTHWVEFFPFHEAHHLYKLMICLGERKRA